MIILNESAEKRLEELRDQYREARKNCDGEWIAIILHQVKSIKSGERVYIYDLLENLGKNPKSKVTGPESPLRMNAVMAVLTENTNV